MPNGARNRRSTAEYWGSDSLSENKEKCSRTYCVEIPTWVEKQKLTELYPNFSIDLESRDPMIRAAVFGRYSHTPKVMNVSLIVPSTLGFTKDPTRDDLLQHFSQTIFPGRCVYLPIVPNHIYHIWAQIPDLIKAIGDCEILMRPFSDRRGRLTVLQLNQCSKKRRFISPYNLVDRSIWKECAVLCQRVWLK